MKKIIAYVTNHGHMDIEWYQPLDTFRYWMSEAVEMLAEFQQKYPEQSFIFDGAVFPVEAVLKLHPEYEETIRKLIENRKLLVGPFYTQFDEFLNAGETIVDNCLFGDRLARAYGSVMKAGYLPDNFGHPSQLPQIFRNFGIDNLLFTRGMPDTPQKKKEFYFVGDDGSTLFGVNFAYYATFSIYQNNDPAPGAPLMIPDSPYFMVDYQGIREISEHRDHEKIARELIKNVRENAKFYPSGIVPMFMGCDHCPPQKDVLKTIALANRLQDEIEFVFGDGDGYSALLRKEFAENADKFRGNLLGLKTEYMLLGAMSARTYLKRMHDHCEHILYDYALPAHAIAACAGFAQPETMLTDARKKLMLCSTHDTIHGSSLDTVHIEQEARYSSIEQNGMWAFHEAMEYCGRRAPAADAFASVMVFTPVGVRNGVCETYLVTHGKNLVLRDSRGQVVPCEILPNEPMRYNVNGDPALTPYLSDDVRRVRFITSGNDTVEQYAYTLSGDETPVKDENAAAIENEFFRVSFADNAIRVLDKKTGAAYDDLNQLIDLADDGDIWDYSEPWTKQKTYSSGDFAVENVFVTNGSLSSTLTYSFTMMLPEQMENGVRGARLIASPVICRVRLYRNVRRIDVFFEIENRSRDHAVRLRLPRIGREQDVLAGGLFTVQHVDPAVYLDCENVGTASDREVPFRDFVVSRGENGGLLTAVKGLYTYEFKDGAVEIPLFRSVGRMTKPNMLGRKPGNFCSSLPIDGAECLRRLTFALSYVPLAKDEPISRALETVDAFLRPPMAHPMRVSGSGEMPNRFSPVLIEKSDNVLVSVFRKAFDGNGAILRVYEAVGKSGTVKLESPVFGRFFLTNMNETAFSPLEKDACGAVSLTVGPHKIITILMKEG